MKILSHREVLSRLYSSQLTPTHAMMSIAGIANNGCKGPGVVMTAQIGQEHQNISLTRVEVIQDPGTQPGTGL